MTPVRLLSGRAPGCVLYQREDQPNNQEENNKNSNISNNNNNESSKNDNSNNNGDNHGYGYGSNYSQSPTSSAIEIVVFSSVGSSKTHTAVASSSTSSTSSSFIPISTFSSSSSFDIPTSRPPPSSSSTFPSSSTSSSLISPSPISTANYALGISTSSQGHHPRLIQLGSIVAIILGCLFCITIALVIYVITRPRFGSLGRLWKKSKVTRGTIGSFEPKEFQFPHRHSDFYLPESRPMSRSLLLPSLGHADSSNESGPDLVIPRSPPPASMGVPDECHSHGRVVSSRTSTSTSASRLSSSGVPRQSSRKHRSMTRIMSILDGYPFEHQGIGERPARTTDWGAADHHHDTPNFPRNVHGTAE